MSALAASAALADEGMWTYDNFPTVKVRDSYGEAPDPTWLDHMQKASVKLGKGCSASFVSSSGLILTNHHCVRRCIEDLSSRRANLIETGFYAAKAKQERRCPGLSAARLESIDDVTEQVKAATVDQEGEAYEMAMRRVRSDLEAACAKDDKTRCDVVRLYNGGRYHLYRYRHFSDVRLVFAPEDGIASFGGDPDNFEFPRYCLDVSLVRAYEGGRPIQVEHFLKWAETNPEAGDLVYVSGHPGRTQRGKTIAQLAELRDHKIVDGLLRLAEQHGMLEQFVSGGPEQARVGHQRLFRIQNAYKVYKGRLAALQRESFFAQLVKNELNLRSELLKTDGWQETDGAWTAIEAAEREAAGRRVEAEVKEHHRAFGSKLFGYAWDLVRSAQERTKPSAERMPEYADARLSRLEASLLADRPVYPELEETMLRWGLTRARQQLGPDDPFIRRLLGGKSPAERAAFLVRKTRLGRQKVRARLYKGGIEAITASKDPMIRLVLAVEADGREVRSWYEASVEPIIKANEQRIADARFAVYGTTTYPDATGSLRLSFGKVEGFPHRGQPVPPVTVIEGLRARASRSAPFILPRRWAKTIGALPADLPVNLTSNNDIIGGNSGSPMVNAAGELVGVVFDGNRYSLGGAYGFDPASNRTVSVHAAFIRAALERVYKARRIAEELGFNKQ